MTDLSENESEKLAVAIKREDALNALCYYRSLEREWRKHSHTLDAADRMRQNVERLERELL